MTDPLEAFRQQMGAMTPGPVAVCYNKIVGTPAYNTIGPAAFVQAGDDCIADCDFFDQPRNRANAVGFATAVRLAHYLASPEARVALARVIDPAALWEHTGIPGFPLAEAFTARQDKALAKADEWLSALAQIALQPAEEEEREG